MPIYEYKCKQCGKTMDQFFKMAHKPSHVLCDSCGGEAGSIVSLGGVQGDEPSWIDDNLRNSLQDPADIRKKPITSRTEYKKYLKDNDIVPIN